MPWFDIAVLAVLAVSGLLALVRGFVREVLSIASWVGAAAAALFLYPELAPHLEGLFGVIEPGPVANIAAGGVIFLVSLIVFSLLAGLIADRVQDSALGPIDRTLGLVFGLVRGAALLGQQGGQPVLLGSLEPLVVGLARDAEHPAGLAHVVDRGGVVDQPDTTVVHNVFVGHGMASCSLDLSNPETAPRGPHLHGGWPGQVSPQPVIPKA